MVLLVMFYSVDSYNIDQHDYSVRLKAARKFLKDGDKVAQLFFSACVKIRLTH